MLTLHRPTHTHTLAIELNETDQLLHRVVVNLNQAKQTVPLRVKKQFDNNDDGRRLLL